MLSGVRLYEALGGRAFARRVGALGVLAGCDGLQLTLRRRPGRTVERVRIFPGAGLGCRIEARSEDGLEVSVEALPGALGSVVARLAGEVSDDA